VVQLRNLPIAGESFGYPDMKDIVPLQQEFNEKTTDISDIINYHAAPVTVVYGAKATNLEKGAKKIWGGLPKDAKIENLELKSDLKASMDYVNMIKTSMFEIQGMPEDALGSTQTAISNTSGIALHMKNQSLIDVNNIKRKTFKEGIQQISRLILKYAEIIELDGFDVEAFKKLTPIQKYVYDIEFPDPLPKDELIEMQLIAQKLSANLITHIQALEELGEETPTETWELIKQEMLELGDLAYQSTVASTGGVDPYTDPQDGNPQTKKSLLGKSAMGFNQLNEKGPLNINIGGIVHGSEKANPVKGSGT
jgi:hypothetical protein